MFLLLSVDLERRSFKMGNTIFAVYSILLCLCSASRIFSASGDAAMCHIGCRRKMTNRRCTVRKKGNICSLYPFPRYAVSLIRAVFDGPPTFYSAVTRTLENSYPFDGVYDHNGGTRSPGVASHCRRLANSYGHQNRRFFVASNSTERNEIYILYIYYIYI